MNQTNTNPTILLRNVRLSYPNLFKPVAMEAGKDPKFSASFLMDKTKHKAEIDLIRKTAAALALEKFGPGQVPKNLKICLRDGLEKAETDGYGEGVMFTSASSKTAPVCVDSDKVTPLTVTSPKLYAGCYVHASIRLWVQSNEFGKKVNAELKAVMFVGDGEPFGDNKPVSAEDAFAGVPADDDEGAALMGGSAE